jgi:DNA-binding NarL/FixJ family response regulator
MIRVLIADDHVIVRRGLKQIINESPDMGVVAEASNGQEALRRLALETCDVAVLDISMPIRNGLDILPILRASHPNLPVLVLSMYPEEQYALRVLKAGASGYMNKQAALDELVEAIRKVAGGGRYVSPSVAERLVSEVGGKHLNSPHEELSDREYQVLIGLGVGKAANEIARELLLSPKTVSTYRRRILAKMRLTTTADIVRYVIAQDLP